MNNFIEMCKSDGATVVIYMITVVGFILTFVSFIKIGKIKEGQIKYKSLADINGTITLLHKISDLLKTIKAKKADYDFSDDIDEIQGEINQNIGKIEAIDKALLDEKNTQESSILTTSHRYHSEGFYDDNFFSNIILKAKKRIVICCKRNTRPFKQENIDKLIDKATAGVDIQILSFSPKMNDALLEEIRKSVPYPPKDIEELKKTQQERTDFYQERKSRMEDKFKHNFKYYETSEIVWFNFVLVDDYLYWGIVNYKKTDEVSSVYRSRPYIVYSLTDPFAKK